MCINYVTICRTRSKNKRELLVAMSDKSSEDLVAQFLKINIDELERILDDVKIVVINQIASSSISNEFWP